MPWILLALGVVTVPASLSEGDAPALAVCGIVVLYFVFSYRRE